MKKKYLKPAVEKFLTFATMLLALPGFMLDDFDVSWKTFSIMIIYIAILGTNIYLLKNFGRGLCFEKGN